MNLSDKAMLVSLKISQWSARKYDKAASAEVAQAHAVSFDVGRYNKLLVDSKAIQGVQKAAGAARTFFYEGTLPWLDTGARILPCAGYFEFIAEVGKLKAEFDQKVDEFVAVYPSLVSQARMLLNGLFNFEDYPPEAQIRNKFGMSTVMVPFPDANDFRVDLSDEALKEIQAGLQAQIQDTERLVTADLWNRIYEPVKRMADSLSQSDKIFRDSLVGNLVELTETLPKLNVYGNPDLDAMCHKIQDSLCCASPALLRQSPSTRQAVAREANAILDNIGGLING